MIRHPGWRLPSALVLAVAAQLLACRQESAQGERPVSVALPPPSAKPDASADATPSSPIPKSATLEVFAVDDENQSFKTLFENAALDSAMLPHGFRVYSEAAPVGTGKFYEVYFLHILRLETETLEETKQRAREFFASYPLLKSAHIALGPVREVNTSGPQQVIGYRTFILVGEASVTDVDVIDAEPVLEREPRKTAVTLTLNARGAQRLEELTRRNVGRRLAIVVDGIVASAPVVHEKISGGRLQFAMGAAEPAQAQQEARELAKRLRTARPQP